ncbi:MAG: hypothetical protein M3340_10165 [Actinomycetota bacterium]|nr:hypothetical protein [Actinomycetota bacterium]
MDPRSRRLTWIAGLAAAGTFLVGSGIWGFDQPNAGASAEEILEFYSDTSTRIVIGGTLSLVAIALFTIFASGMRLILREHDVDDLFGLTAFGGMLLLLAAGMGAETINMVGAMRAADDDLSAEFGRSVFEISYVLGYNAAGLGAGIALLGLAGAGWRSPGFLPGWAAPVLAVVGLLLMTPLSVYLFGPAVVVFVIVAGRAAVRAPSARPR